MCRSIGAGFFFFSSFWVRVLAYGVDVCVRDCGLYVRGSSSVVVIPPFGGLPFFCVGFLASSSSLSLARSAGPGLTTWPSTSRLDG